MDTNIFINEALNSGIVNYLNKENSDDFITVIVDTLVSIYGELDIINPYKTKNESSIGGFDYNLSKYGYSKENISIFKKNVMNFYTTKEQKPNKYFNLIEKNLIDMFFSKYKSVDKSKLDIELFKSKLTFEGNPLNEMYSDDKNEIEKYYNLKKNEIDYNITYEMIVEDKLSDEAYTSLGYSLDNIKDMNEQQILEINNKIFEHYNINKDSEDRYVRLEQALEYYKEFPKKQEEPKKENGYTEIVLILGFVLGSLITIAIIVGVLK